MKINSVTPDFEYIGRLASIGLLSILFFLTVSLLAVGVLMNPYGSISIEEVSLLVSITAKIYIAWGGLILCYIFDRWVDGMDIVKSLSDRMDNLWIA